MTFGLSKSRVLDYKRCYDLWVKQRISPYKIVKIFTAEGIINRNGKPLTHQAIWRAAYLYALDNLAEAKRDAQTIAASHNLVLDEPEFYKDMVNKASQFYGKNKYREYMKLHSYMKPYEKA